MRRTQLYLDDDLWNMLHERAASEGTTVSDLVRKAVRERYPVTNKEERRKAMMAVVGIWKDRTDLPDTDEYLRSLRQDKRFDRLMKQMRRPRKP